MEEFINSFDPYIIKKEYPRYIDNYDKIIYAFLYELGSIFTGICLTEFCILNKKVSKLSWDENSHKVLNFDIKRNINISHLKLHDIDNIYAIKVNGITEDGGFLTSYLLFSKINAEKLVEGCF